MGFNRYYVITDLHCMVVGEPTPKTYAGFSEEEAVRQHCGGHKLAEDINITGHSWKLIHSGITGCVIKFSEEKELALD